MSDKDFSLLCHFVQEYVAEMPDKLITPNLLLRVQEISSRTYFASSFIRSLAIKVENKY
jgi:hypothetical protein